MPVDVPARSAGLAITVTVPPHVISTSGTLHINIVQRNPPKRPPAVPPRNYTARSEFAAARYETPRSSHQSACAIGGSQSPPYTTPPPTPVYGPPDSGGDYIEMLPGRPPLPLPLTVPRSPLAAYDVGEPTHPYRALPESNLSPPPSPVPSPSPVPLHGPTPVAPPEFPAGGQHFGGRPPAAAVDSSGEPIYYECCASGGAGRDEPPAVPPRPVSTRPKSARLREKTLSESSTGVVETARSLSQGDDPRHFPGKPPAAGAAVFRRMASFMKNKK